MFQVNSGSNNSKKKTTVLLVEEELLFKKNCYSRRLTIKVPTTLEQEFDKIKEEQNIPEVKEKNICLILKVSNL